MLVIKTTNASQGYEIRTMKEKKKKYVKRSCIRLLDTVQRHHSISVKCVEMVQSTNRSV